MTLIPVASRALCRLAVIVLAAAVVSGCGSGGTTSGSTTPSNPIAPADTTPLVARLDAIDAVVGQWRSATDLAMAHRAAEAARNLVVGPNGPNYGDADGDGTIEGANAIGLLPGLGGEAGLATEAAGPCVERDVLGGSWADPTERWSILEAAIDAWAPSNNTFPSLPSHPQRIVGWATLALASAELATALEYGGHAHLHIDVSLGAIEDCPG